VKPHTTRLPKQQGDQKGIRGERGGSSVTLLGKRAIRRGERGWKLMMNTHDVEFSIAGCVEEIVRDPNLMPFFSFFHFFFLHHAFIVIWYKKLHAALAMEKTKPINQNKKQKKP